MHGAFKKSIDTYKYSGRHYGVFPYKVNQRKEFIDAIVSCGKEVDWGLEVGSKTEFMAALSYELNPDSLLICNGFKDSEFINIAFSASKMGKNVIVVVEGADELELIRDEKLKLQPSDNIYPQVGLRVRLYSKGSGKWEKSSGETSKFGLTTVELIHALDLLKKSGMEDQLTMLHFHIGSQITAIKRFKNALKEAARVYAKTIKMGFKPKYLNIGGGVGVDYDGSKTTAQSSANYTLDEFASDAVYVIGEVCKEEGVPCPDIITESGRVIAAYHSVLVTDIREVQGEETLDSIETFELSEDTIKDCQSQTRELKYILNNMNKKNYVEFYHDALQHNEELTVLFN
jgi:arginine decarboxylase